MCLPGQLSVSWDRVSCQALWQRQRLLSAGTNVVKALRQEDHAGPSLLGFLHQLFAGREVGLFVRGGCHLTDSGQRAKWAGHAAQRRGCFSAAGWRKRSGQPPPPQLIINYCSYYSVIQLLTAAHCTHCGFQGQVDICKTKPTNKSVFEPTLNSLVITQNLQIHDTLLQRLAHSCKNNQEQQQQHTCFAAWCCASKLGTRPETLQMIPKRTWASTSAPDTVTFPDWAILVSSYKHLLLCSALSSSTGRVKVHSSSHVSSDIKHTSST